MKFTVATYNIHKGFSHLTRRMVIHEVQGEAARAVRRRPVPAGGPGRPPPSRRPLPRLAGKAAARIHRRQGVARGGLRPQRGLPAGASRQRGAVALSDPRPGEPGHLGARVREPRPAALRDQARRGRQRCIASTSISGCSSAAGSGRSARCASASATRCRWTRR